MGESDFHREHLSPDDPDITQPLIEGPAEADTPSVRPDLAAASSSGPSAPSAGSSSPVTAPDGAVAALPDSFPANDDYRGPRVSMGVVADSFNVTRNSRDKTQDPTLQNSPMVAALNYLGFDGVEGFREGMAAQGVKIKPPYADQVRNGGQILVPEDAPDWMRDPVQLVLAAEAAEKRRDATLGHMLTASLPEGFSRTDVDAVTETFARRFLDTGHVVVTGLHDDNHVHMFVLDRPVSDTAAPPGDAAAFSKKKDRNHLNPEDVKLTRQAWQQAVNDHALAHDIRNKAGAPTGIDLRSRKDRGLPGEPTERIGRENVKKALCGQDSPALAHNRLIKHMNREEERIRKEMDLLARGYTPDQVEALADRLAPVEMEPAPEAQGFRFQKLAKARGKDALAAALDVDGSAGAQVHWPKTDKAVKAAFGPEEKAGLQEALWETGRRKDAVLLTRTELDMPANMSPAKQEKMVKAFVNKHFLNRGRIAVVHRNENEAGAVSYVVYGTTRPLKTAGQLPQDRAVRPEDAFGKKTGSALEHVTGMKEVIRQRGSYEATVHPWIQAAKKAELAARVAAVEATGGGMEMDVPVAERERAPPQEVQVAAATDVTAKPLQHVERLSSRIKLQRRQNTLDGMMTVAADVVKTHRVSDRDDVSQVAAGQQMGLAFDGPFTLDHAVHVEKENQRPRKGPSAPSLG